MLFLLCISQASVRTSLRVKRRYKLHYTSRNQGLGTVVEGGVFRGALMSGVAFLHGKISATQIPNENLKLTLSLAIFSSFSHNSLYRRPQSSLSIEDSLIFPTFWCKDLESIYDSCHLFIPCFQSFVISAWLKFKNEVRIHCD